MIDLGKLYISNRSTVLSRSMRSYPLESLGAEQLYLHKNYLDGTIPSEVGMMSNLRNFRVYTNGLKGSIPDEIGGAWKIGKSIIVGVSCKCCVLHSNVHSFLYALPQNTSTSTIIS